MMLDKEGIVDNADPDTKCPGDKIFSECPTAQQLYNETIGYTPDSNITALDFIRHFDILAFMKTYCEVCRAECVIAVEMYERKITGRAQLRTTIRNTS